MLYTRFYIYIYYCYGAARNDNKSITTHARITKSTDPWRDIQVHCFLPTRDYITTYIAGAELSEKAHASTNYYTLLYIRIMYIRVHLTYIYISAYIACGLLIYLYTCDVRCGHVYYTHTHLWVRRPPCCCGSCCCRCCSCRRLVRAGEIDDSLPVVTC